MMILPLIVRKNLRQHLLSSTIAIVSIALSAGLWLTVSSLKTQAQRAFTGVNTGFDAVLGARGSKLQLVLNAVFHLEASPGNIQAEDFNQIQKHPLVALAVPLALGDNYNGFRIAGTSRDLFERGIPAPNQKWIVKTGGRLFDPQRREAILGSFAAQQLKLRVGDTFHPQHGLDHNEGHEHEEDYLIVGILEPTNSPADRVIWIPLTGIQKMSGHDPAASNQLSAVLIQFRAGAPQAGLELDSYYNKKGERLTFAWPIGAIVAQLFDKVAWFERVLEIISILVALIAMGTVFTSLYHSMNERRRDIAILRSLGAHGRTVFVSVIMESLAIVLGGIVFGFFLHGTLMFFTAQIVQFQTGVVLDIVHKDFSVLAIALWLTFLAILAGIVPAVKAYRTPVAENLNPIS